MGAVNFDTSVREMSRAGVRCRQQRRVRTTNRGDDIPISEDNKKIFVGGLSAETTSEDLKSTFGQWGGITHAAIKIDMYTGYR